ncbi:hypothetical protein C8Q80DRAFT_189506 [Daedaleopsis nitida]|nr:hypothetical protein C8Q80DRAFT_189506 [Daedaleopsis nitida]
MHVSRRILKSTGQSSLISSAAMTYFPTGMTVAVSSLNWMPIAPEPLAPERVPDACEEVQGQVKDYIPDVMSALAASVPPTPTSRPGEQSKSKAKGRKHRELTDPESTLERQPYTLFHCSDAKCRNACLAPMPYPLIHQHWRDVHPRQSIHQMLAG